MAFRLGLLEHVDGGGGIFNGNPSGIKQGDLTVITAARFVAGDDGGEIRVNGVAGRGARHDGMMQIPDRRALVERIDNDLRRREETRVDLLLVLVVGTDRRDERARADVFCSNQELLRRRAGGNDISVHEGCSRVGMAVETQLGIDQALRESLGGRIVWLDKVYFPKWDDILQGAHMHESLTSTAEERQTRCVLTGKILGGDGGGSRRALRGDLDGIEQREEFAGACVGDDDDALDRGEIVPRGIAGEIGVGFRDKIIAVAGPERCLDVESTIRCVHPEDLRRRQLPFSEQAESALDGDDAFLEIEERANVCPGEQQGGRTVSHEDWGQDTPESVQIAWRGMSGGLRRDQRRNSVTPAQLFS